MYKTYLIRFLTLRPIMSSFSHLYEDHHRQRPVYITHYNNMFLTLIIVFYPNRIPTRKRPSNSTRLVRVYITRIFLHRCPNKMGENVLYTIDINMFECAYTLEGRMSCAVQIVSSAYISRLLIQIYNNRQSTLFYKYFHF